MKNVDEQVKHNILFMKAKKKKVDQSFFSEYASKLKDRRQIPQNLKTAANMSKLLF